MPSARGLGLVRLLVPSALGLVALKIAGAKCSWPGPAYAKCSWLEPVAAPAWHPALARAWLLSPSVPAASGLAL